MKLSISLLLLLCSAVMLIATAKATVLIPAQDERIFIMGRTSPTTNNSIRMDWPGVEFSLTISNTTAVYAILNEASSYNSNYYLVFINGVSVGDFSTIGQQQVTTYLLAGALDIASTYTVSLYKRTEANSGIATFGGFILNDGGLAKLPQVDTTKRIEFIGDSLTVGFGNLGIPPCNYTSALENNYLSWAPVTARAFGAQYHVQAWSGRGLVRNYGSPNKTSPLAMPELYRRTIANEDGSQWDFSLYKPQVVFILLGGNDYSTQPFPDTSVFVDTYVQLIQNVTTQYQGELLHIFACCPIHPVDPCCANIQQAVKITSSIHVTYLDLNVLTEPTDYGCLAHPSVQGDIKMSATAIDAVVRHLGWKKL